MPAQATGKGGWTINDFSRGLNLETSPLDMQDNECLEAFNVKFFKPDGCISPRQGRRWLEGVTGTPMVSSVSTHAIGIHQYVTSAGSSYPVIATCCSAGPTISASLGYLNSTGYLVDLIATSLSPLHYEWIAAGRTAVQWLSAFTHYPHSGDHICMTNYEGHLIATWAPSADYKDHTPPIIWNGITGSATVLHISAEPQLGPEDDATGASADRLMSVMIDLSAGYCATFKGYLFLMNNVEFDVISSNASGTGLFSASWYPSRARWNNPAASSIKCVEYSAGGVAWEYEDYLDFDPDDGYGITGYGIMGDEMLIFKKNKTYAVSWVGGDMIFNYRNVSDRVGCVSHRSIVTTKDGAAWAGEDGFYYYDGKVPQRISGKIKSLYTGINVTRRHLITGGLWPEYKQIWWSVPTAPSETNNLGLIFDFSNQEGGGSWSTAGLSVSNIKEFHKQSESHSAVGLWATDYNGWGHLYDSALTTETSGSQTNITARGTKASAGIPYSWKSIWLTFDDLDHNKRIKRIRSVLNRDTTAGHLSVAVRKNWEDDGIVEATSLRPLSGRSAGISGDYIYDKYNFTANGQAFQLHYATSAGSCVDGDSVGISSHKWTLHEIQMDYDTLGTLFYGDY